LHPSQVEFAEPPPARTRITLDILAFFRLVRLERRQSPEGRSQIISSSNLTILNFILVHFGPMHERTLCIFVGTLQILCSAFAFWVRYGLGAWVYGGDRR
jgi:UDP-N-acetylglucosamine--dolichyl-phosphate N-acetylglucosaminephosphotransferase